MLPLIKVPPDFKKMEGGGVPHPPDKEAQTNLEEGNPLHLRLDGSDEHFFRP